MLRLAARASSRVAFGAPVLRAVLLPRQCLCCGGLSISRRAACCGAQGQLQAKRPADAAGIAAEVVGTCGGRPPRPPLPDTHAHASCGHKRTQTTSRRCSALRAEGSRPPSRTCTNARPVHKQQPATLISATRGVRAPSLPVVARPFSVTAVARSLTPLRGETPTMELAMAMPRGFCDMSNETLCIYAAQGDHGAHRERLLREIMSVDGVSWQDAHTKLDEMEKNNKKWMFLATVPYKTGVSVAVFGAVASLPMVFDLTTALWFNEYFVTQDIADPEDLETALEVGAWTWGYMEPPLGHISFFLLCLQFARNQMLNIGAKPYTGRLQTWRAKRLARQYPMYSELIVTDFAVSGDWHD